jgi:3-oxoadipate enol-lactonase
MPERLPRPRLHSQGAGQPVVLLHCLGVDRHVWDWVTPWLTSRFQCLSYDFPGHGETGVSSRTFTIEDLTDQLAELLSAASLDRVHLLGISLGGLVAQDFAARYAARTRKLVLIDTTPRYTDELRAMWHDRAATARTQGVATLTPGLLDIWFTPAAVHANTPQVSYVRHTLDAASGAGYAFACEALAAADVRERVPDIGAETLVVCGDQDIPSFLEATRWLSDTIRRARVAWLSPARHASMLEQPDAFASLLTEFL